jgi:D-xylose transport system permease protein
MPIWIAAAVAAIGYLTAEHTRFGRHLYAIGGNPEAAHLAGISVSRHLWSVFVIAGLCTALAGLILCARTNGVTPGNTGHLFELDVVTAVVIGGTSLLGGRGSILGSVLGALLFGTLANGMNLLEVDSNWQLIFKGLLLMTAVGIDVISKGKSS